jgi:hypothetical protein
MRGACQEASTEARFALNKSGIVGRGPRLGCRTRSSAMSCPSYRPDSASLTLKSSPGRAKGVKCPLDCTIGPSSLMD